MPPIAAGLLMFRRKGDEKEYFLVHPGGPFYTKKNQGVWSIPKGLPEGDEIIFDTAKREFFEETGITPQGPYYELGWVQSKSRKIIHVWAFEGEWDPAQGIVCNMFDLEWPPKSGKIVKFPEADRAAWMDYETALLMINSSQLPFLERAKLL
jgi:predicted NUDIX family NTP pyrophosphohydrolase